MAIVVESVTETLVGANDSTPTFNMPATRPDSDLYVVIAGCDGAITTYYNNLGTPFNKAGELAEEGTVGLCARGRVGSSEPASYTVTGDSEEYVFYLYRLSGTDTSAVMSDGAGTTGNSTAASAPAATADAGGNDLVIRGWCIDTDNPTYNSGPTGHTFRGGSSSSAGGAGSAYIGTATRDALTSSSESIAAATMPGTYDDNWCGITVLINTGAAAPPSGTGAGTFPKITGAATGTMLPSGTGAGTFPKLTGAATGTQTQTSTAAGTFPKLTGAATATQTQSATGAGTFPKLTGAATGTQTQTSTGAGTFPKLTGAAEGTQSDAPPTSTGAGTFPKLTGAATGAMLPSATAAGTFPKLTGSATGTQTQTSTAAGTFPKITGSATGTQTQTSTAAGTFPKLTGAAVGEQSQTATAAGTFPKLSGAAVGEQTQTSTGAGTFPRLTGSATGTATVVVTASGGGEPHRGYTNRLQRRRSRRLSPYAPDRAVEPAVAPQPIPEIRLERLTIVITMTLTGTSPAARMVAYLPRPPVVAVLHHALDVATPTVEPVDDPEELFILGLT